MMNYIAHLLIALLFSGAVLAGGPTPLPAQETQEINESYSFENDMEGWTANGLDLSVPPIYWSISRSQELAKHGATSLRFEMNNVNDAGKIYIEKAFAVEPNQLYDVEVSYDFASRDWGDANFFWIITGALKKSPTSREELQPAFQDDTGNKSSNVDVGYRWLEKEYGFTVQSGEDGRLYVVVGVWGSYEVFRRYYFDNVRVKVRKRTEPCEFFSFEDDFEGWDVKSADLETDDGSIDWSITRSQSFVQDGASAIEFDLTSSNGKAKLWIERPFTVEPKKTYRVIVEYGFAPRYYTYPQTSRIITGVFKKSPVTADDLIPAYQGKPTNGDNWGWVRKKYEFTIRAKKSGVLYVAVGIWGKDESRQIHYFDNMCVTITRE